MTVSRTARSPPQPAPRGPRWPRPTRGPGLRRRGARPRLCSQSRTSGVSRAPAQNTTKENGTCVDKTGLTISLVRCLVQCCRPTRKHAARGLALRGVHAEHSQKAGPFSVARLRLDMPFHNRLASTGEGARFPWRVHCLRGQKTLPCGLHCTCGALWSITRITVAKEAK